MARLTKAQREAMDELRNEAYALDTTSAMLKGLRAVNELRWHVFDNIHLETPDEVTSFLAQATTQMIENVMTDNDMDMVIGMLENVAMHKYRQAHAIECPAKRKKKVTK